MSGNDFELWRVMTPEGIFQTDLDTLRQWIAEGCVLSTDKVAKGNLNWIEAGRAPVLRKAFAGAMKAPSGVNLPVEATTTAGGGGVPAQPLQETNAQVSFQAAGHAGQEALLPFSHQPLPPNLPPQLLPPPAFAHEAAALSTHPVCFHHATLLPVFICRNCAATFCGQCPKFVNQIAICPLCGDLCKPFQEFRERSLRREQQASGFGFAEFGCALSYPFQHIFGLLFMSGLYGLLLCAGLKGWLLASGLLFGCMAHVISQFAWGRTDKGILPEFDGISWWDDVVRPLFLSLGIFLVTLGPMIVLLVALWYGLVGGATPQPLTPTEMQPPPPIVFSEPLMSDEAPVAPGAERDPVEEATRAREEAARQIERIYPPERAESSPAERTQSSPAERAEGYREARPQSYPAERAEGYPAERATALERGGLSEEMLPFGSLLKVLGISGAVIVLFLLALGWAAFYYPMALAVAGYTEDFWSVVNPLVGLDTIRRMGLTYFKAFLMYLSVKVVATVTTIALAIILSPFHMPFFGNLPAQFANGFVTFYTSLVIACILGFALFKCADRLDIRIE